MSESAIADLPFAIAGQPPSSAATVLHRWCLENCVPDPVVPTPTLIQCEAAVQKYGKHAPDVLINFERERRKRIKQRDFDPYKFGYVPAIWQRAEQLLWDSLSLFVIFGANRSSKTWFCVWAAIRHMIADPEARVLFLHNDQTQSADVHQAIFWHYFPLEWKPKAGKRKGGDQKINYNVGTGFTDGFVGFPNGATARFGNYMQDWTRFEGAPYTLINASERFPLPLMETLGFRLPGAGQKLTVLWDYSPIHGITPSIERVIKGARCIESERSPHLPANHIADRNQDWKPGRMPRLQEGATEGVKILYFWSEDNPLGAGVELRKKMEREKWDTLTIERRMHGFARNVTGRALPKFGKANIRPLARWIELGFLKPTACRRFIYDPAGSRNPFMSWLAGDEYDRHLLYREWPDRPTHGEWAIPSSDESKWNGDRGPAQEKIGLFVVEQKRLILEAEGWIWDERERVFKPGPNGIEEIVERLIDPRAGAALRQQETEEQGENLIDIFEQEQRDKRDGAIIGPSMSFNPASGIQEDHGIEIINTKYLGYDSASEIVPLVNEPHFLVAAECEQTIYSCLNYRPGRGKRDEACKDPLDNVRYYFTSDPVYLTADSLVGRNFQRRR